MASYSFLSSSISSVVNDPSFIFVAHFLYKGLSFSSINLLNWKFSIDWFSIVVKLSAKSLADVFISMSLFIKSLASEEKLV